MILRRAYAAFLKRLRNFRGTLASSFPGLFFSAEERASARPLLDFTHLSGRSDSMKLRSPCNADSKPKGRQLSYSYLFERITRLRGTICYILVATRESVNSMQFLKNEGGMAVRARRKCCGSLVENLWRWKSYLKTSHNRFRKVLGKK